MRPQACVDVVLILVARSRNRRGAAGYRKTPRTNGRPYPSGRRPVKSGAVAGRAFQRSVIRPWVTSWMALSGKAARCRSAEAICPRPLSWSSRSAALRSPERTCGPSPVRTRQASSPRTTSFTQCSSFSIRQWPRASPSSRPAGACSAVRLVTANTVSRCSVPPTRRTRSSTHTCSTPGQSRYSRSRGLLRSRRYSTRPCPLPAPSARPSAARRSARSLGGKSPVESRGDGLLQLRLVVLDRQEVVAPAVDHRPAEVPLGERRVAGDHHALQRDQLEQRQGGLGLVGVPDRDLGQHGLGIPVVGADQVDPRDGAAAGATQPLAVDGYDRAGAARLEPVPQQGLEGFDIEFGEHGGQLGDARAAVAILPALGEAEQPEQVVVVAAPLGDGREGLAP